MTLTWTERSLLLWGRLRDGFESHVFNGVYQVGKVEMDKEKPMLLLVLSTQAVAALPVCYRAVFSAIVDGEDTTMPRSGELSDFFATVVEAQQWCQDLEDHYQTHP